MVDTLATNDISEPDIDINETCSECFDVPTGSTSTLSLEVDSEFVDSINENATDHEPCAPRYDEPTPADNTDVSVVRKSKIESKRKVKKQTRENKFEKTIGVLESLAAGLKESDDMILKLEEKRMNLDEKLMELEYRKTGIHETFWRLFVE